MDKPYEEIRAIAFEEIEAMIRTLDAAQLFDHDNDRSALRLGIAMFSAIVGRVKLARRDIDAAIDLCVNAGGGRHG